MADETTKPDGNQNIHYETKNASDDFFVPDEPEILEAKLIDCMNTLSHTLQRQTDLIFQALEVQLLFIQPPIFSGNETDINFFQEWQRKLMPRLAFIRKTRGGRVKEADILWPQINYIIDKTTGDARGAANQLYDDKIGTAIEFLDKLQEWWNHWRSSRETGG